MTVLNRGRDGHAKPNEIGHIASKPRRLSHSMPSTTTTTGPQPELPRDAIRGPGAPSVFQGSSHRTSPRRRIDDKVTSELVRAPLYVSHHPWPSRCVGRGTDDRRQTMRERPPNKRPPKSHQFSMGRWEATRPARPNPPAASPPEDGRRRWRRAQKKVGNKKGPAAAPEGWSMCNGPACWADAPCSMLAACFCVLRCEINRKEDRCDRVPDAGAAHVPEGPFRGPSCPTGSQATSACAFVFIHA